MSLIENKGLLWSVAILAAIAMVIIWMVATSEPYRLILLFDDAGNLKVGDPVVWKTYRIGRVEKIRPLVDNQVGVTVRLNEEYIPSMTTGTEFILKQATFLGLVGDNAVEVITPSSPGKPIPNGSKLQAKNPPRRSAVEDGKKWTMEFLRRTEEGANQLIQDFRNSPFRQEADEALTLIRNLAKKGSRETQQGLEQFRKDHQKEWEEAMQKLERLRDELRKKGDERNARRMDEEIGRMHLPAEAPPK